ncbi:WhiB family transcriptional regulator [Microlunatus elymi]|uniref:Transcriptional regulator WhiB n=1 Tax=Microlunatus elymi TaxID=2596828 RepID=A0A516PVE1_9ACTN|nr:WhiB family transcriptional regulator [Microlunatus elymi]QDP95082.1 WhiB family transcriptional regulator [Microlunatus elymi]
MTGQAEPAPSEAVVVGRPAWAVAADRDEIADLVPSCARTTPDVWFSTSAPDVRLCARICAGCPLRSACLAGALVRDEEAGIWGGVRFTPAWDVGEVVEHRHGYVLDGRSSAGTGVGRGASDLVQARARLRRLLYQGRRRRFVTRLVHRVGKPVRMVPGGWWVGPWIDPDRERGMARMRELLPAMLAGRPVQRWPWELRLLFEFPECAIPEPRRVKRWSSMDELDPGVDHERESGRSVLAVPHGRRAGGWSEAA